MGILRSIESSLERVVEGSFGRLFRASVQPVELARKLAKELEEGKVVSVTQTYAPNEYTVYLSRKDRERFAEYEASLRSELASYLSEQARRSGYVLPTRPRVRFETSTQLAVGIFGISTAVVQEEASEAYERRVEGEAPAAAPPAPAAAVQPVPDVPERELGELISLPMPPPPVLPLGPVDAVPGLDLVAEPEAEPEPEPENAEDAADGLAAAEVAPPLLQAVPELPSEDAAPEEPEPEPGAEAAGEAEPDPAADVEPEPEALTEAEPERAGLAEAPVEVAEPSLADDEVSEPFDVEAYVDGPAVEGPVEAPPPAPVVAVPPPPVAPLPRPPVAPLPTNVTPIRALPSVTEVVPSPMRVGQLATEEIALVQDGRRYPIDQPVVVLGRAPGCDITLDDRNVSRRHAEVRRRGPVVVLVDLESTNGTIVNGRRIREHPLADGDRITLGNSRLTFERRTH